MKNNRIEFQRRHFEFIAELVREISHAAGLNATYQLKIAEYVAHKLKATNPRFNFDRFVEACQS